MSAAEDHPRFRPGQRWYFYTGLEEFQRELVVLGRWRAAERGEYWEVAVPFAPSWQGAPGQCGGTALCVREEGLEASVVDLLEEDLAPGDARLQMRPEGTVHFTEGTVDDGLRERLAALQWETAERREATADNLLRAIEEGNPDEVRRLIDARPDLLDALLPSDPPGSPLRAAVREDKTDVAALLLDLGADANAAGPNGETPLHAAAAFGRPEAASLLIAHGASVGAADGAGVTPLLAAARSAAPDALRVVRALEDHGAEADLNALVALGRVEEAARRLEQDPRAVAGAPFPGQLLEDAMGAVQRAVLRRSEPGIDDREAIDAVMAEYLPMIERLLDCGADPDEGFPLWSAVQLPDLRPARLLLQRGANPNLGVSEGRFLPDVARGQAMKDLLRAHGAKNRNDPEAVVRRETEWLACNPEDAAALKRRATALQQLRRWNDALADWEQALLLEPEDPAAYAARAWIMAACPDERIRDGLAAVQAARRAIDLDGGTAVLWDEEAGRVRVRTEYLETLAAAWAECGRFDAALATMDQALAVASPEDRPRLRYRRKLFESQTPYRDLPGADDPALYREFQDPPPRKRPGLWARLKGLLRQ